jgi:hypothetical protein
MRARIGLFLVLAAILALVGPACTPGDDAAGGSRLTRTNFDQIRADMKTTDVTALLGEPSNRVFQKSSADVEWIWKEGDKEIHVTFTSVGFVLAHGKLVVKDARNL